MIKLKILFIQEKKKLKNGMNQEGNEIFITSIFLI